MPDEQNLGADATGLGTPVSSQRGAGQSSIIGAKELQAAIDKFDRTVDKLEALANKSSGMGSGGSNGGISRQQTSNGLGFLGMVQGLSHAVHGKDYLGFHANPNTKIGGAYTGFNQNSHGGGGGGAGFLGQTSFGGQGAGGSGTGSPGRTGNSGGASYGSAYAALGGTGTPTGGGGTPNNNGGHGGSPSFGGQSPLGSARAWRQTGFLATVSAISSFGAANMNTQVGMNAYIQRQQVAGMSSYQSRNLAYGTNGRNINTLAQGPSDASAGASTIASYGGWNPNSAGFQSGYGATNMIGMANPTLGYAGSANLMNQIGSNSASMSTLMSGFTGLRGFGGKTNSLATMTGSFFQRSYGQRHVAQNTLNASLRNGGVINTELTGLYGAQAAQQLTPVFQDYNRLSGKMSNNQITTLMNQAARGNKGALGTLSKNGISETDLQKIQTAQGVSTATQGDLSQSFSSGLSGATSALTSFRKVIEGIVNIPGVNQAVGGSAGFAGTLRNMSNPEHLLGGVAGVGMMTAASTLASKFGGGMMSTSMAVAAGATPVAVVAGVGTGLPGAGGLGGAASKLAGSGSSVAEFVASGGGATAAAGGAAGGAAAMAAASIPIVVGILAGMGVKAANSATAPKGTSAGKVNQAALSHTYGASNAVVQFGGGFMAKALTDPKGWVGDVTSVLNGSVGAKAANHITGLGGAASSTSQAKTTGGSTSSGTSRASGEASSAISWADKQVGKPYVWGGLGPDGFDCSGLVYEAYLHAGLKGLPRTSQEQWTWLEKQKRTINPNQAKPGDLVFKAGSDGTADSPGHVAMVQGGGNIVEAQQTGVPIHVRKFNPGEWNHAGRPTGAAGSGGTNGSSASGATNGSSGTSSSTSGNSGAGSLSSTSEADNISSALGMGTSSGGGSSAALTSATGTSATPTSNGSSGGTTSKGKLTPAQIAALWKSQGGPSGAASNMAKIAMAESGDVASVIQKGVAAGVTGYGLYQITPTSGIVQNGKFGNLLNAANNTKAAISLYKASGYSPWSSDAVGASLSGKATGGAARDQAYIVGERGPEVFDPKNQHITDAKRTAQLQSKKTNAQGSPFSNSVNNALNTGPGAGSGVTVNLQFKENSICFNMSGNDGAKVSKEEAAHSVQEIISQIQTKLQNQQVYTAIANGDH